MNYYSNHRGSHLIDEDTHDKDHESRAAWQPSPRTNPNGRSIDRTPTPTGKRAVRYLDETTALAACIVQQAGGFKAIDLTRDTRKTRADRFSGGAFASPSTPLTSRESMIT
ncbi:hypothetical protein [Nonomuraea zeae]|uniref:Uncharacterized protein n=1 Tax=Nonomuraea zeae TaxID=1642303 RepID=A0A5S4G012_9ACTN|nr:hypothetical protein [Nonomuraea zeae]TMR26279.1 hypothetical protein ETD85_43025 [Nonomuraea zeae]